MSLSKAPQVSVVVPAMNEELTISDFIDWCTEGFQNAGVTGEIIIMDSSTDATPTIAAGKGARVVRVDERGLGAAYDHAKAHIRGKVVILGDADCTYDFRNVRPFLEEIEKGSDFVMGSRFRGSIESRAMPPHHQYFGSPLTTVFFRMVTGIRVSDIHCGMRALTTELYMRLPFIERGWLYATEMIAVSKPMGAMVSEVPIAFLREPEGRQSHHVRAGWLSPFISGWGTLRVTVTYALGRLLLWPGLVLGALFFFLALFRFSAADVVILWGFGQAAGFACSAVSLAGFFAVSLGIMARSVYSLDPQTQKEMSRKQKTANLAFTVGVWSVFVLFAGGLVILSLRLGEGLSTDMPWFAVAGQIWILFANLVLGFAFISGAIQIANLVVRQRGRLIPNFFPATHDPS